MLAPPASSGLQAVDPFFFLQRGKADTRWLQAVDPFFFLQRGKADTRCRKKNGSTACETAPELVRGQARERRTAQVAGNERPRSQNPHTGRLQFTRVCLYALQ